MLSYPSAKNAEGWGTLIGVKAKGGPPAVPVRVDFTDLKNEDPNHQLRPGLSVEPKVWVK